VRDELVVRDGRVLHRDNARQGWIAGDAG